MTRKFIKFTAMALMIPTLACIAAERPYLMGQVPVYVQPQPSSAKTMLTGAIIGVATGALTHLTDENFFPLNWGFFYLMRYALSRAAMQEMQPGYVDISLIDEASYWSSLATWIMLTANSRKRMGCGYHFSYK